MTIKKNNERGKRAKAPAEPIDIDAALARLILLRKFHELPRPIKYEISYDFSHAASGIYLKFATPHDLGAWADVLEAKRRTGDNVTDDGTEIHSASRFEWNGWYVNLTCYFRPGSSASALDADTVAGLEEVAAEPKPTAARCENTDESKCCRCRLPVDHRGGCRFVRLDRDDLVSDETIAEAEQISKLVASTDLHLPKADCGCPIKGSGLGVYIDHCAACREAVSA